jgi:hypothetical protein
MQPDQPKAYPDMGKHIVVSNKLSTERMRDFAGIYAGSRMFAATDRADSVDGGRAQ